jgi:hypothetical protein
MTWSALPDSLYLSDGRLCHSSENPVNNINMVEVYHEIRGNLEKSIGYSGSALTVPDARDGTRRRRLCLIACPACCFLCSQFSTIHGIGTLLYLGRRDYG